MGSSDIDVLLSSSNAEDFQKILLISQVSNINTIDLDAVSNDEMFNDKNIKK